METASQPDSSKECRFIRILASRTICQTTALRYLVINMVDCGEFSNSSVVSWLRHTRNSLQELECKVETVKALNVVDIFGRGKLGKLILAKVEIKNVDPNVHRFSSLRALSLADVLISEPDFGALLDACPVLESLQLIYTEFAGVPCHLESYVKFSDLIELCLDGIGSEHLIEDNLILELDSIKRLQLARCYLESLKLIGEGSLKEITICSGDVGHLELCDSTQNLETIDICQATVPKSDFYSLVSKSSKFRELRLDCRAYSEEYTDLEIIATSCPQLTRLFLKLHLGGLQYCIRGPTRLENLVFLEVKLSRLRILKDADLEFFKGLLEYCPNLKKLVFRGEITGLEAQVVSRLMGCINRITRKYAGLDVQVDLC